MNNESEFLLVFTACVSSTQSAIYPMLVFGHTHNQNFPNGYYNWSIILSFLRTCMLCIVIHIPAASLTVIAKILVIQLPHVSHAIIA